MNKMIIFISLIFSLSFVTHIGHTQTDFTIKSSRADIEKEYRQELDQWILRAYEGDRDAQFKVGVLFTNDQFDRPDYEQAVYWYKQAARQGHVLAQYNLGHQYLAGQGVQSSERQAMEWWLKAAEQDHALAQFNVGRGYYLGIGLEEDHEKSRAWFERAAQNGEPKSIEILKQINWPDDNSVATSIATKDIPKTNSKSASEPSDTAAIEDNTPSIKSPPTNTVPADALLSTATAEITTLPSEALVVTEPVTTKSEPVTETSPTLEPEPQLEPSSHVAVPEILIVSEERSIEVFTNPKIRSLLITIANLNDGITIEKRSRKWTSISSAAGFPVWVHGDFVSVKDNIGQITGSNVNARSEPKISNGSVVGRFNEGESATVIESNGDWHRLISPTRFTAWVKTKELDSLRAASPKTNTSPSDSISPKVTSTSTTEITDNINNNEWLFSQSPEDYTLQLASFNAKSNATKFLENRKLDADPNLRSFASSRDDLNLIYYLYGSYTGKSDAKKAKKGLKLPKAWVRSFGQLQQNRCVTWKTQLPTPQELKTYCLR